MAVIANTTIISNFTAVGRLDIPTVIFGAVATREQLEHEMSPFMLNVRDEAVPV